MIILKGTARVGYLLENFGRSPAIERHVSNGQVAAPIELRNAKRYDRVDLGWSRPTFH